MKGTQSKKPRLFCEFPAGLAAVSLRLQGGQYCRPPISRMGSKSGFSKVILGVLGLHSGQGAGAYWWAEADQDVAALLRIYPDPDALLEVARIIRGWAGEEPRALWERLRAERKERGSRSDPGGVAGWIVSGAWSFEAGNLRTGFVGPEQRRSSIGGVSADVDALAEYAMIASGNRLICVGGPDLMNTGDGGTRFGGEFATPPEQVAAGMERVAGYLVEGAWAFRQGELQSGGPVLPEDRRQSTGGVSAGVAALTGWRPTIAGLSGDACPRLAAHRGWPPVCVSPSIPTAAEVSAAIGTPGDLEGCIVYVDGPYENTTGYGHELPRSEQVRIALDFAGAGATVALSEAEPIPALTGLGWYATEITGGRVGQKRTFSKQQREFITMNKAPGFCIEEQVGLFGGGR